MKLLSVVLYGLPAVMAYPGFMGVDSREEMAKALKERHEADLEKRQGLNGVVSGLTDTISGLLGSVASEVDPQNARPEPGYEFQAPGPNDSRGPCPGLNLLANYGYLPRDGYVNYGQVLDATARGFNMHADLATVLAVFAILTDGDITTESWYLGGGPDAVGGLSRHDTVECDVSANREDFYNGCGDNHHVSSRLFTQNVELAKSGSGMFDIATMTAQYAANAEFSKKNNPYLYYFPFPSIVSVGGYAFYSNFFSNGTYGAGGVANYESISSIIGAKYNSQTGEFEYVPERWPENWYRRATPYGAVDTLIDGFLKIYPANPIGMPIAQLGTPNLNVTTILCDVIEGIGSVSPIYLSAAEEEAGAAASWALGKLADVGLSNTILGCPTNALSNVFLYPNASVAGGPLNPPPTVVKNSGNNVYNKTYFTSAPVTPQCSHSS